MRTKIKWVFSSATLVASSFLFWGSSPSKVAQTSFVNTDLAPAITPDAKELTRITNDNLQEWKPRISPDGKKILYYSEDPMQAGSKRYHINLKTLGDPGTTPLLTEGCMDPSWMPDNKGFFFTYAVPSKPVVAKSKIDQGGINYVSANANGENDGSPENFKASGKILFHTKVGEAYQIATIDPNGLGFTLLGTGFYPTPHPKNNSFLFSKWVGNYVQIFTYDIATGQQTQLTSGNFHYEKPRYSPDGKWIAFQKSSRKEDLKKGEVHSSHIFIMDASGNNVKQLTTGNTWNSNPEMGIDNFVYFSSNAGNSDKARKFDNVDIWKVRPNLSE